MARVERAELEGLLCAKTVTTIHYIVSRWCATRLSIFSVGALDGRTLASDLDFSDYEDAVLHKGSPGWRPRDRHAQRRRLRQRHSRHPIVRGAESSPVSLAPWCADVVEVSLEARVSRTAVNSRRYR